MWRFLWIGSWSSIWCSRRVPLQTAGVWIWAALSSCNFCCWAAVYILVVKFYLFSSYSFGLNCMLMGRDCLYSAYFILLYFYFIGSTLYVATMDPPYSCIHQKSFLSLIFFLLLVLLLSNVGTTFFKDLSLDN